MSREDGITTGDSPSERHTRRALGYLALAQGLRKDNHEDAAIAALSRAQEFYASAERARQWEGFRFDKIGR